jgi:hypothetical protein
LVSELFNPEEQWSSIFGVRYFNWHREFEEKHPLLFKLQNAQWRYGCRSDPAVAARYLRGFLGLKPPPGLEFRLTWTLGTNEMGPSVHDRVPGVKPNYLDAPMGLLVYCGDRLVMTVGIAPCLTGLLVAQVQLREPTGNRWLYRLPGAREGRTYLDWVLGVLRDGFPGEDFYLPTGASVVDAVVRSYGRKPHTVTPEVAERLRRFYDQPLAEWERTDRVEPFYRRNFVLLKPIQGRTGLLP